MDIESASKKHGFMLDNVFYSSSTNNLSDTKINQFDGNFTINDFIIKDYAINDLNIITNYDDVDGDFINSKIPFTVEETNYSWSDNKGIKIVDNDRAKKIGCGSGFSMPLNLTITTKVKAYSEYGIPNESEYAEITQKYKIMARPEICYAKPYGMVLRPQYIWGSVKTVRDNGGNLDCILTGTGTSDLIHGWNYDNGRDRDSICGGGYNSNVFDPIYGFKASANPHFPTTGFSGARFQLVMSGHQDDFDYTLSAMPNDSVEIDNQGNVMLLKKPVGKVIIKVKFKNDEQFPEQSYSFNLTGIWALPQGQIDKVYTYQEVVNMCGGESKLPTRTEMSNSPNAPASWIKYPYEWDAFTRDIGTGLLSEWGMTTKETYPDSNWFTGYHWFYSKDKYLGPYGDNNHLFDRFAIDAWIGQIGVWAEEQQLRGVCVQ